MSRRRGPVILSRQVGTNTLMRMPLLTIRVSRLTSIFGSRRSSKRMNSRSRSCGSCEARGRAYKPWRPGGRSMTTCTEIGSLTFSSTSPRITTTLVTPADIILAAGISFRPIQAL